MDGDASVQDGYLPLPSADTDIFPADRTPSAPAPRGRLMYALVPPAILACLALWTSGVFILVWYAVLYISALPSRTGIRRCAVFILAFCCCRLVYSQPLFPRQTTTA